MKRFDLPVFQIENGSEALGPFPEIGANLLLHKVVLAATSRFQAIFRMKCENSVIALVALEQVNAIFLILLFQIG